ncbi:unnamed protein product [Meloidogyne enterolobii]|uniref:Uncharacterized protein n=1 Tax=Meloidogyne enterolobii TaxID=390850 RepID=A0ACB0Y5E4_MELEN
MVSVSVLVSIPILISDLICPGRDRDQLRVRLIAGTFVVCGIGTILQSGFGLRLALLQGVAFAYIPSVRAFMSLPEYKCLASVDDFVPQEIYENKMAMIQGTLMASSCVTMLIGATGLVGIMTKYIGPMTVSPLLMLMMLSSVKITVERVEKHWISLVMAASLFATVLYLSRLQVPFLGYSKGKFRWYRLNVFGQFPVIYSEIKKEKLFFFQYLTAILFSWGLCFILTIFNLIPKESVARTDKPATLDAIYNSPYARFPFPGQFGFPKFNIGLFVGFLVSAQTTLFEAVGNYHAVASERPPPSHALNRGIMAEGLGCFISGLIGPGVGITTHAENVGVIGITRVASRITMIFGGCTLIAFGVVTKLGAILSAIPDPLVGVVLSTSMAMVGGVAIANVQTVDLKLTRNVAILGFSIMLGVIVPEFYERNPTIVATGYRTLDQVIQVLLSLPMFVGAATACFLDNTVGGATRQQRGLRERGTVWEECDGERDVYLYPNKFQQIIDSFPILRYLPFIPKRKYVKEDNKNNEKQRNGVKIVPNENFV